MSTPDGGLRRSAAPDDRTDGARTRRATAATWAGSLAILLAAGAASVVVLSDDARLLRLGAVAALWAGLIAVFVLARRVAACVPAADAEAEVDRLRRAYESELFDRAEYEENLERDLRAELSRELAVELAREAEERRDVEVAELRAELERLQARAEPEPWTMPAAVHGEPGAPPPRAPGSVPVVGLPVAPTEALGPLPVAALAPSSPVASLAPAPPVAALAPAPTSNARSMPAPSPLAAAYRNAGAHAHHPVAHPVAHGVAHGVAHAPPTRPRTPPHGLAPSAPGAQAEGVAAGAAFLGAPPAPRVGVLGQESFVDGYLRSAGYDVESADVRETPSAERTLRPMRAEPPEPSPRGPGTPGPGPEPSSATTGRTVAELLAAHAARGAQDSRRGRPAS